MNMEQYLEYGGSHFIYSVSSAECCQTGTMSCPGDSAVNKTYLAFKESKF